MQNQQVIQHSTFETNLQCSKLIAFQGPSAVLGYIIPRSTRETTSLGTKSTYVLGPEHVRGITTAEGSRSQQGSDTKQRLVKLEITDSLQVVLKKKQSSRKQERQVSAKAVWDLLFECYTNRQRLPGRILHSVKGGYAVGVLGIVAFLPQSKLPKVHVSQLAFKILSMSEQNHNIVLSAIQVWKNADSPTLSQLGGEMRK